MREFNKYLFIEDLTNQLKTEIKEYDVQDMDKLEELISESIDNECIYNANCFAICYTLDATDFTAYGIECQNINQLAYAALDEFVREELDYNELEEFINEQVNA
jgi:hypothetical protein